jgi:hypothetical protein
LSAAVAGSLLPAAKTLQEIFMQLNRIWKMLSIALLSLALATPALAAEVYGRVVGYDKAEKKMTFIVDALNWSNPKRPEFTVLPPREITLAEDPGDMAPKAGGRMRIDYEKKEIIIYNASSKGIDTLPVEIVNITKDVEPDNALVAGKSFPVVDKEKSEITIYSKRQKSVATVKVPADYMSLPENTWDDGHNIKVNEDGSGFVNLSKAK